jgi:NAD(P)H-dependent FMN reductase
MKDSKDSNKQSTELQELLAYAKNTLHEQQELFIAMKTYQDLSLKEPDPEDLSPKANSAREKIKEAKVQFENLHHIVYGVPPEWSSSL